MGCLNSKATAEKSKPSDKADGKKAGGKAGAKDSGAKAVAAKGGVGADKLNPDHASSGGGTGKPGSGAAAQNVAETFLKTILEGAEHFFSTLPDSPEVKQMVALTFMNSCLDVTRTRYRLKMDDLVDLVSTMTEQMKLPLLQGTLATVEERSTDDSFSRIVLAWHGNNPSLTKKISGEAAQALLDTLYIRYSVNKPSSFEDILVYQFRWISVNLAAMEVFSKFGDGKGVVTMEQMGRFLRETQGIEITDRQVMEKFKYRFGGGIHRYNFASYNGSVLTNNAIDPARISDVWQDMTQSFTHYMVHTARIESEEDLKRAIAENTRALVLNIKKEGSTLYSGACTLESIADAIKKGGFVTNTYPIVLCLSPGRDLPVPLQTEVAALLTESLGQHICKGLMFEGAVISDPKFSPGALRKKVLIMGPQSNLRPFVGFMVADMNKDGLGVRVTDVVEATPAAKGGVQKDDWLTHFNGEPIQNKQHLREHLAKLRVGEEFSVKRENLDEIKIVVGGVVDGADTSVSPELSALVFFKYAAPSAQPKPWDTELLDAQKLGKRKGDAKKFGDHFGFVSITDAGHAEGEEDRSEGVASRLGVQFIDADNSERGLAWSRGRFCDNGRCGFLLKTDMDLDNSADLTLNVIGGPRAVGCAPLSSATITMHGGGEGRHSGSQISFTHCNEATIAVVQMTFESQGVERTFTASFCPATIRPGYRAMPCLPTGEERSHKRQIHGIYIFAKRS